MRGGVITDVFSDFDDVEVEILEADLSEVGVTADERRNHQKELDRIADIVTGTDRWKRVD